MNKSLSTHVFVSLYVMLGDADSSIEGSCVITRENWEKQVKKFKNFLSKKGIQYYEGHNEHFGMYNVNMENYTVQDCTEEEAKVLKKFGCDNFGDYKSPTEWIEYC